MHAVEDDAEEAVARLREQLGGKVLIGDERNDYSHDRSHHPGLTPVAVVRCTCAEDVATALRTCNETATPVVPRGTGTGLEGGANPVPGSVCVDVSGMSRILQVDAASLDARVEAGVKRSQLNPLLAADGLFFPVGPGVDASIGGMAATSASGTNAVRYGTMRDAVLGLTVVLADGRIVRTGGRTRKSSAGYDLTHLFVGSEGTLGIITDVTLRLHTIPETAALVVWSFPDVVRAATLVERALASDVPLGRAELLDEVMVRAMNAYSGLGWPERPVLMLELSGGAAAVRESMARVESLSAGLGATPVLTVTEATERERTWQARHDALPSAAALIPGSRTWSTDVCVPVSRLAECIGQTKRDVEAARVLAPIVGHVGDGNFHLAFVLPPGDAEAEAEAERINDRMIARALEMDGTCTGEHGIGTGKVADLEREHPSGVPLMRSIKDALDPRGIMNPGTVIR